MILFWQISRSRQGNFDTDGICHLYQHADYPSSVTP
jgi:hypothetical protein